MNGVTQRRKYQLHTSTGSTKLNLHPHLHTISHATPHPGQNRGHAVIVFQRETWQRHRSKSPQTPRKNSFLSNFLPCFMPQSFVLSVRPSDGRLYSIDDVVDQAFIASFIVSPTEHSELPSVTSGCSRSWRDFKLCHNWTPSFLLCFVLLRI